MNGPAIRILAIAAVAMLGLVGLVVEESLARAAGTEVTLAMQAVDPRALLSGHYVAIGLNDVLPPDRPCPPGTDPSNGRDLWIALAPNGDRYAVAGAAKARDTAARYSPLLARGSVTCFAGRKASGDQPDAPGAVTLDLGVDRFYASQDEAKRIDSLLARRKPGQDSPVAAIVSIGQDGKARLKGLKVDGRRIDLSLF